MAEIDIYHIGLNPCDYNIFKNQIGHFFEESM